MDGNMIIQKLNIKLQIQKYALYAPNMDNLAKDDLYFTNKEDLKNMIEGWDNQLEKQ